MGGPLLGAASRRRTRAARLLVVATIGVVLMIIGTFQASAADSDLQNATSELQKFATALDGLSTIGDLVQDLPATAGDPSQLLKLADAFDDTDATDPAAIQSLRDKIAGLTSSNLADPAALQSALDAFDHDLGGGVMLSVGGPTDDGNDGVPVVTKNGTTNVVDITLIVGVKLENYQVPISLATDVLDLNGTSSAGKFPLTFDLHTSPLHFRFDPATFANPATTNQAFSLLTAAPAPSVTLSITATNAALSLFSADLGFSAVDVTGLFNADIDYLLTIDDPDGAATDGKITADELTSTSAADLLHGGFAPDGTPPVFNGTVNVNSSLINTASPTTPDLVMTLSAATLTSGVTTSFDTNAPVLDFRNFSAEEALAALGRLLSVLDGLQATGGIDIDLPFITGKDDPTDPNDSPSGTFVDALPLGQEIKEAIDDPLHPLDDLTQEDLATTDIDEDGKPDFANAQTLLTKVNAALDDVIDGNATLAYNATSKRLEFAMKINDSGTGDVSLNLGDLDILSSIDLTTDGTVSLKAGYGLNLDFALDLHPQPTEDGAEVGSCSDGIDNGGAADGIDGADPDCATAKTLEQRVELNVADPKDLAATFGISARNISAKARVGMLEADVAGAYLALASTGGEDGTGPLGVESCADGVDNGDGGGIDLADPDCSAGITANIIDTGDGWLTVEEFFNAVGHAAGDDIDPNTAGTQAPPAYLETKLSAGVAGKVPVSASVGGQSLGSGDVTMTNNVMNVPVTDAAALVTGTTVTGNFAAADFAAFSPCSNNADDDGDGAVNDGCGTTPAVDGSEASTLALLDKIVDGLRAVTEQLEANGIFPAGTFDQELPLLGLSLDDILALADSLTAVADSTSNGSEDAIGACGNSDDEDKDGVVNDGCPATGAPGTDPLPESDCADIGDTTAAQKDDDGDGTRNDGCQPEVPSVQELANTLAAALERALDNIDTATTDIPNDVSDAVVSATVAYDATENDVSFKLDVSDFDYTIPVPFALRLPDDLATIVDLSAEGTTELKIQNAKLKVGFGIDLDDNAPFVLGDSFLEIPAKADSGNGLTFTAGVGPIQIQIGETGDGTPENDGAGQCSGPTDDDGDGFPNDGCPQKPDPETGADCGNKTDNDGDTVGDDGCGDTDPPQEGGDPESGADCAGSRNEQDNDGDGIKDDGCPADPPAAASNGSDPEGDESSPACALGDTTDDDHDTFVNDGCPKRADKARFALGGKLRLDAGPNDNTDTNTRYTIGGGGPTALSFTGAFDGVSSDICDPVDTSGPNHSGPVVTAGTDKDVCAVLPLYLNGTAIGTPPDHHVELAIEHLENFTFDDPFNAATGFSFQYDTSQLSAVIEGQIMDLVLMESGIEDLLNLLQNLLESDLFSFALPLIGGQTASAASIVDDLRQNIKDTIHGSIAAGQNPADPASATVTAGNVKTILENIKSAIAGAFPANTPYLTINSPAIGMKCDPAGGGDARDCDTTGKGEDDTGNPGIPDANEGQSNCADSDGDPATNTGNGIDDDHDGTTDDGCGSIPAAQDTAQQVSDISFPFELTGVIDLLQDVDPLNFDIGIPGLSLEGGFRPNGTINYSLKFGFGLSKDEGFYFLTDTDADGNDEDADPELDLSMLIGLSDADTTAGVTGQLGFLQVDITDQPNTGGADCDATDGAVDENVCNSLLGGTFSIDLLDPDHDGKLTITELSSGPSFTELIKYDLTAFAEVNLHIETSIAGSAVLPRILADLHLDWNWSLNDEADTDALAPGSADSGLTLVLDNVNLDAGTFLAKFLGPILKDVKKFTEPFQPIIDTLNACIPVISDLAGNCTSLLDIALAFAPQEYDFIIQVVQLIDFINSLPTDVSGRILIPINGSDGNNSFTLAGETLQEGAIAPTEAQDAYSENINATGQNLTTDINNADDGHGGTVGNNGSNELKVDGLAGIGLHFPFLEHPEKLLGLLFGQDVDLIVWEPDPVKIEFSYSQKFGPIWAVPPVFIEIGGAVSVTGTFGIGYSTKGFTNWLVNQQGPAALLQGLFLLDKHPYSDLPGGADINELELRGEIFANAQVSVLIFSAGAQGSVYLTIGIDLQDPNGDGRLEYTEAADIIRTTGNVLCIFNLNGKFGVTVSVFAEVDLFFWSQRWEQILADIVIYEFKVECKPLPDPVLARFDGDILRLNVGPDRKFRDPEEGYASPPYVVPAGFDAGDFTDSADDTPDNSVGFDETAENYLVTMRSDGGVDISAFGVVQTYAGPISKIVGDADDGAVADDGNDNLVDVIAMADGKPATGGGKVAFTIPVDISGGSGKDELTGGDGSDTLNGGAEADVLNGDEGAKNTISGGDGNDAINSGAGDDTLNGDADNDTISGGLGIDTIDGGSGNDVIDGGRSAVGTPDGGDTITAGDGDDTVDSGDGDDTIHAGQGKDVVNGGNGHDTIDDAGTDEASCSNELTGEDDVLVGGPSHDDISGAAGDDIIIGGNVLAGLDDEGDDNLDGGNGCDIIYGDNAERLDSGPRDLIAIDAGIGGGDKSMDGGSGSDDLFGQKGADTMTGGTSADNLRGMDGADVMDGGAGTDNLWGDVDVNGVVLAPSAAGPDDMVGGDGNDHLWGDGGEDYVLGDKGTIARPSVTFTGGSGVDVLRGGSEADHMYGQGGADQVHGDSGDDEAYGDASDNDAAHNTLDGNDLVRGGIGNDYLFGNNAADDMFGDSGDDRVVGGSPNAASLDSGLQDDVHDSGSTNGIFGDHLFGGTGNDHLAGDNATITGGGAATLLAEATIGQPDLMLGEAGHDRMYGEHAQDDLYGGDDDDHLEGGDDNDDVYGENGQDDLIGGTTEAADGAVEGDQPDGADNLWGGNGHDVLAGDNASIIRSGPVGSWTHTELVDRTGSESDVDAVARSTTLFDVATVAAPTAEGGSDQFSGIDVLHGEDGYDILYGQGDADALYGGKLDDYLEGNADGDTLSGEGGQDDLVGGTGRATSDAPNSADNGRLDGADNLYGNNAANSSPTDDYDVLMGDNATVLRGDPAVATPTPWVVNTFNASIKRQVTLYDVGTATAAAGAGTSGGDLMRGQDAADLMYGQGDADDMEGGSGDDYMEGNAGSDKILGQDGNDDMIGGTGRIRTRIGASVVEDPATGTNGRLDAGETNMLGGDGFDVMTGDNAIVARKLVGPGDWVANTYNLGIQHELVRLLDLNSGVQSVVSGGDYMEGNEKDDVMYGQANGNDAANPATPDVMKGNIGDDYMEGNAGADVMQGNADQDDMVGGTGRIANDNDGGTDFSINGRLDGADDMVGDSLSTDEGVEASNDYDVMAGDNAEIVRPLTTSAPTGKWTPHVYDGGVYRTVTFRDIQRVGGPAVSASVSGADTMYGNGANDIMRGQGGNDTMHGNAGHDDMEGNHQSDHMWGDDQQDDMLGGSRTATWFDTGDFLYGGNDHDVVLGDNGTITRPLTTSAPVNKWKTQSYGHLFNDAVAAVNQTRVVRTVGMVDTAAGQTSGSDVVHGQAGDDDLYGQFDDTGEAHGVPVSENCDMGGLNMANDPYWNGEPNGAFTVDGDLLCGGQGEDAVLGDQGVITDVVQTGPAKTLTHSGAPFIKELTNVPNALSRQVVLSQIPLGGADVILGDDPLNKASDGVQPAGNDAHDSIHAGAGADLGHGGPGDDFIFGDDGTDALWGGDHADRTWGGFDGDWLDVLPRTTADTGSAVNDPITWFFFAGDDPDTMDNPATEAREGYDGYRGFDTIYGGWDQDTLQANEGDNGPVAGDRLVDWSGSYNGYYLCPATYGEYVSTRQMSPSLITYLEDQGTADGATNVKTGPRTTGSGYDELAIVYKPDVKSNTNPVHPDTPAHFTCR
ncbi:MAG TPA: calcium-binding protein [Acidimicrobiales bacterium]|nr:calcium-binding protein [Acidimicrobiales bacterium]